MTKIKHWATELCIQAMQRYTDACRDNLGEEPTITGYDLWRAGDRALPSSATIIGTLGSWNEARTAAARDGEEIYLNARVGENGRRRWTLPECLDALSRYEQHCQETGQRASNVGYIEWHKQTPDTPSTRSIENFGSWNTMRLRAVEQAGIALDKIRLNPAYGAKTGRGR